MPRAGLPPRWPPSARPRSNAILPRSRRSSGWHERSRMSDPMSALGTVGEGARNGLWTARLVWYLRAMAGLSFIKGLYHWSAVIGIGDATGLAFETSSLAWKTATIFF